MTPTIIALITVLVGLGICFAGYRLFRVFLTFFGFILGFTATFVIATGRSAIDWNNVPVLVVAVIVGIVVALFAWLLYRFGVAIAGFILGASVAYVLIQALGITGIAETLVLLVCVVLGAALAFAVTDLIVMLSTALSGANLVISGITVLLPTLITGPLVLIATLILAVLGFVTQWQMGGRRKRIVI